MTRDSLEGHSPGVTVCVELVDARAQLEAFFKTHSHVLEGNTVIFKEVEHWEYRE